MTTDIAPETTFAVDFAALAREIACDIFPLADILKLHQLDDETWTRISQHPRFVAMLRQMTAEWNSASNTRERVSMKAATGLESMLEVYIRDINDPSIPLNQRVEAGKFLAKLGELDTQVGGDTSGRFTIQLNIGETLREASFTTIDAQAIPA